jgi:hypothetical protein
MDDSPSSSRHSVKKYRKVSNPESEASMIKVWEIRSHINQHNLNGWLPTRLNESSFESSGC